MMKRIPILAVFTAVALLPGAGPAAAEGDRAGGRGLDAVARVFDPDSRVVALARFVAEGDRFELTKRVDGGGRAYLQYKYIRTDGTFQGGEHWGLAEAGGTVVFDHDFGEGRKVLFRVCAGALCSGTSSGENWTIAYA
ncbi:hypothetical protein [Actinoplanes sp. NPDC023714]|uniref:hypothetical protein n=1 Tax=Actinoplanes sp. NPDC023714 TaxID=3154322 RepID=UPI0033E8B720